MDIRYADTHTANGEFIQWLFTIRRYLSLAKSFLVLKF